VEIPKQNLQRYTNLTREFTKPGYINLNPIQRGGVLTEEARRAILEFGDGYSVCDWCPAKTPRLDMIERPPIKQFLEDMARFLGMDVVRIVTRCREAKFITFLMLARHRGVKDGYVVIDSLAHYSTYLAAELAGLRIKEVPNSGYPEYRVDLDVYAEKIEEVKRETGEYPVAVLLTHVDYQYGNLNDAKKVARIAHDYDVPFVLNAAYTAGLMPINGKELEVDVLVGSGHKSWAASAPTGILAMTEEMAKIILARSKIVGDWSGRSFPQKELALLGCTVMGAPIVSLMASFPHVVERVKRWSEEVEKARYLVEQMERIEGTRQLGVKPKEHTLIHIESEGFFKISQKHKRKGYFLYHELKKKKIVGIQPGMTKHFKLNTYGLSWDEVKYVANAFIEIAEKYGLQVS